MLRDQLHDIVLCRYVWKIGQLSQALVNTKSKKISGNLSQTSQGGLAISDDDCTANAGLNYRTIHQIIDVGTCRKLVDEVKLLKRKKKKACGQLGQTIQGGLAVSS